MDWGTVLDVIKVAGPWAALVLQGVFLAGGYKVKQEAAEEWQERVDEGMRRGRTSHARNVEHLHELDRRIDVLAERQENLQAEVGDTRQWLQRVTLEVVRKLGLELREPEA